MQTMLSHLQKMGEGQQPERLKVRHIALPDTSMKNKPELSTFIYQLVFLFVLYQQLVPLDKEYKPKEAE